MHVHLPFQYKKAIQALNFFARESSGRINKMKAIKLIYFADRYHVRKYGRPITNDEYFAMKYGPVNSGVKDLAEMSHFLDQTEREYASKYILAEGYDVLSVEDVETHIFSESDLEALFYAWKQFGNYDQFKLAEISHHYPEWYRWEEALEENSRFHMDYEDFLKDPHEGYDRCYELTEEDRQDRIDELEEIAKLEALWKAA